MTDLTTERDLFPAFRSRKIEARFDGGSVTSDGGSLLVRQADRRVGLTRRLAGLLEDPRKQGSDLRKTASAERMRRKMASHTRSDAPF
jgi:hypothetical protein